MYDDSERAVLTGSGNDSLADRTRRLGWPVYSTTVLHATWKVCKDVSDALDAQCRSGNEYARSVCMLTPQRKLLLVHL